MDNFSKQIYDAGINDGRKEGKAEGKAQEKFATVKRMLKRGKSSLADIAEDTDLPLDTIKKIQAEMQAV